MPDQNALNLLDRVVVDSDIVHGKPRIKGTRMPVQVILELLAAGDTVEDLLHYYEDITYDDIRAAINYAALYLYANPAMLPLAPISEVA